MRGALEWAIGWINGRAEILTGSERRLGVKCDWEISAQQVGYRPNLRNFDFAHERIKIPRERILHVAQSSPTTPCRPHASIGTLSRHGALTPRKCAYT
jgi:hypothetical protein